VPPHIEQACLPCCLLLFYAEPQTLQVRAGLAQLGLRSLDELIGRADYLQQRDTPLAKTCEQQPLLQQQPLSKTTRFHMLSSAA